MLEHVSAGPEACRDSERLLILTVGSHGASIGLQGPPLNDEEDVLERHSCLEKSSLTENT